MAVRTPNDSRLAEQATRRRLDELLAQRLRAHGLPPDVALPHSANDIFGDLKAAWSARRWFLVTNTCALFGELVFGSFAGGGTFAGPTRQQGEVALLREIFRALRDACFHPAHVNPGAGSGRPHHQALGEQPQRMGVVELGDRLVESPAPLRSRELAAQSLRLVERLVNELLPEQRRKRRKKRRR